MEIYNEDIINIELTGGTICRGFANKAIGEGDSDGNRYGARLTMNGEPVDLTGISCVGFFIRSDGTTLVIDGEKENGAVFVTLPEAAYAAEGQFTLAIKVSGTGFTNTVRIVDGTVVNTTTGVINDPASEIPSLAELSAIIANAETAAAEIDALSIRASVISGTRYKIAITLEEGDE